MKKTYYPVAAAWMLTFLILGINYLIRRDVVPMWLNVYVFQLFVPVGGLLVGVTQAIVYIRSLYFLFEKPGKKEAAIKLALSLAWLLGSFLPGVSLKMPDIHARSGQASPAAAPLVPLSGGEATSSNR